MSMRTSTISPGATRQLKNHTSFKQSVRNSLTMAYRGILKIRRTPEQLFDVTLQPIIFTLMFTSSADCNYDLHRHWCPTAGRHG